MENCVVWKIHTFGFRSVMNREMDFFYIYKENLASEMYSWENEHFNSFLK